MNEQLRQQLAAEWMWKSVESGMEQLLNEKAALERALAEALQNPAQNPVQNTSVQNIQAPPPQISRQTPLQSGTMPGVGEATPTQNAVPASDVVFKTAKGLQNFPIAAMCYFEAKGKCSLLFAEGEEKPRVVFHALGEVEQRLAESHFVRCSRFHLVSLACCTGWRHSLKEAIAFITFGGKEHEITVTRTNKVAFIRRWEEYIRTKGAT